MGFKLNFKVAKEYIDTHSNGDIFYPEILVTGSGITDTITISQDGESLHMSADQFQEIVETAYWNSTVLDSFANSFRGTQ